MARIAGVDLPPHKRAEIGLTYIYGIGRSRSASILNQARVNLDVRIRDLSEEDLSRIRAILEEQGEIEGDLRKRVQMDIKRLMDIGAYRGLRKMSARPMMRESIRELDRSAAALSAGIGSNGLEVTHDKRF